MIFNYELQSQKIRAADSGRSFLQKFFLYEYISYDIILTMK